MGGKAIVKCFLRRLAAAIFDWCADNNIRIIANIVCMHAIYSQRECCSGRRFTTAFLAITTPKKASESSE
jgi:hypothetical protein